MAVVGCTRMCSLSRKLLGHCLKTNFHIGRRTILSASFDCNEQWEKRLDEKVIKKIDMARFYIEVNQVFQTSKRLAAVDLDLFAHKVTDMEQLDELEDLIVKFRKSLDCVDILPSTAHAVVKNCLQFGQHDLLLRMIKDPVRYGIFPCDYSNSLLMNYFLKLKNNRDATKIAVSMMLQEDFRHPLSRHLALYSCVAYLKDPKPDVWLPDPPPPPEPEPEDIVVIRLNYLKPKYFDDHFHIKEPTKLIGKTLWLLSDNFKGEIANSCKMIGYAMWGKWHQVERYLKSSKAVPVYKESIQMLNDLLEKIPDDEAETRKDTISKLSPLIENLRSKSIEKDMLSDVEALLLEAKSKHEAEDIENHLENCKKWTANRFQLIDDQAKRHIRKMRLKKLEELKTELKKKEQLLHFFDNYEKNVMKVDEFERVEAQVAAEKAKKKKDEEEYIPPDVYQEPPSRKNKK